MNWVIDDGKKVVWNSGCCMYLVFDRMHEHVRPLADNIKGDRIGLPIDRGNGWNHVDCLLPTGDGGFWTTSCVHVGELHINSILWIAMFRGHRA